MSAQLDKDGEQKPGYATALLQFLALPIRKKTVAAAGSTHDRVIFNKERARPERMRESLDKAKARELATT